ncbi:MAG: NB-ARC domain-containing protein [Elainellaceae cyanobacterium]
MARRKKGVILSDIGWKKLQRRLDERISSGDLPDKRQASLLSYAKTHTENNQTLAASTVSQILNRQNVASNSLDTFFSWFDLTLQTRDYIQPDPDSLPDSDPNPQPKPIPRYIPFIGAAKFVGCDSLMEQLHGTLEQHRLVALAGMGGVGKTEASIQYASRYFQAYPGGVCWIFARRIDAPNNATVATQLISFATVQLGIEIPETLMDADARLQYCWHHWPEGKVLLIYDDVEHYSDVAPHYIPNDERFRILLTTRVQLDSPVHRFPIDVLDRDDALDLLASLSDRTQMLEQERQDADELCHFLGDLPLGVELAGRYLASDPNFSVINLLSELRRRQQQRKVVQHESMSGDYQDDPAWTLTARRGLEAAFDLTWEKLNAPSQLLAKMLGRFEPGPIRWRTVDTMGQVLAEEYPQDLEYKSEALTQARVRLMKYSLLKPFDDRTYRLHPLIREFFRGKTTDEEDTRYGNAL